jgi:dihydrolipoamide dehydrogenase
MDKYDVIVIGSGPGGYVTAIRASQLGFNTAIVEKESLGGVCLNWGCIPTKALLKSAEVYNYLKKSEDYGISAENVSSDFVKVIERSRSVANSMSKGVNFLMKKNKINVINGHATINSDKTITIEDKKGSHIISGSHVIIATGIVLIK